MAIINKERTLNAPAEKVWSTLIDDPNQWPEWLTPIRSLEEKSSGKVRKGTQISVRLGSLGGAKVKVTEVVPNKRLRWKAGPAMMLMMGMGMKGTLDFQQQGDSTRVRLRMVTPMMMAPMMKMMTGLNAADEMEKTITKIKELGEA